MADRYPNLWTLRHLYEYVARGEHQAGLPDGRWVPARPLGFCSIGNRVRCAWMVFTGKADAVTWDGGQ